MLAWYDQYGRKSLPWKSEAIPLAHRPYHIWLSEVMLQQTQVTTVLPYYQRFINSFPSLESLAQATQDEVLALWSGLGYYARGRNLHKAAQLMWQNHQSIPNNFETLLSMPGIGRSTAGAIMAQAFQQSYPILDGNVKRVLARYHAVEGWYGKSVVANELWVHSENYTPEERIADYTQAIMDMGALLCTRTKPKCEQCYLRNECVAFQSDRVSKYPFSKPKKDKPVKQAYLLCVLEKGEVLLEQRPPTGIWGGLWPFPEFQSQEELFLTLNDDYKTNESNQRALESFRHTFSHYHLDIHPHVVSVSDKMSTSRIMDTNSRYFALNQKLDVGIAAPVERILQELSEIEF